MDILEQDEFKKKRMDELLKKSDLSAEYIKRALAQSIVCLATVLA